MEVVEKIILLPRYTSFAGAGTFRTAPMNVRDFGQVIATYTKVAYIGTSGPVVNVYFEQSPDLEIWAEIGSAISDGIPTTVEFSYEWIRVKLVVSGIAADL